jgi:antitoxin YefM
MKSTVLISELSANPSAVIARAEAEGMVPISRAGRTVAFVVGREKLAAILETMELQKDPELMRIVAADRAGTLKMHPLE